MKLFALLGKGLLVSATAAAGLHAGGWMHQRLQAPSARQPLAQASVSMAQNAPPAATVDSLFHYHFVPGERLNYALDASIGGSGIESLTGPGNVAMAFSSDMYVLTEGVDYLGNGSLSIGFDRVEMNGSFMDAPVNLKHSMTGTEFEHGRERLSTAAGDSIAGIPQLEFFNTPTKARISPAGEVLQVSGAPGMEKMLSPEKLLASVQFPSDDLDTGSQWESTFAMPVPGIGSPVSATALNVLEGFELLRGRYCGVVRQTLQAVQQDGTLNAPESHLSEAMGFALPEFNLAGENLIYFDVDNGQLVQADLDLDFTMRIGQQLKPIADMLNLYGNLLNDLEGNQPSAEPSEDLLDLGLQIQATMALITQ